MMTRLLGDTTSGNRPPQAIQGPEYTTKPLRTGQGEYIGFTYKRHSGTVYNYTDRFTMNQM